MTKAFLDSAYPPNDAQLAAARSAGYSGWNGYFAGPNILNGWSKADFDRVKAAGLATLAYCSGWSSATAMRAQAAAWDVKICLDVEGGIRALIDANDHEYLKAATPRPIAKPPQGSSREAHLFGASSWVQPWLSAAAAGVYGNYWVHPGLVAAFYILAAYPTSGDPYNVAWWGASVRPGPLCGWQWAGSHDFAGRTVDSNWFDDTLATYLGAQAPKPAQEDDDDMLYVSKTPHKLAATFRAFAASALFSDPSVNARQLEASNVGWTDAVDYFVYSSSGVESTNPPGTDHVWWHVPSHNAWIPDAVLDTTVFPGAPPMAIPANEPLDLYLLRRSEAVASAPTGVTQQQVDDAIARAIARLRIVPTGPA